MLFCVFFFKQKTAYEMRISDWSSDVCSSDLGFCRHLLQIELQTARQHGNGNLLWVGRGQDELDVRRRLFERFQHGIESMAGQQIGRASCRERVCQYV